jgi:hypothetical protein
MSDKKYSDKWVDILSGLIAAENALNGPGVYLCAENATILIVYEKTHLDILFVVLRVLYVIVYCSATKERLLITKLALCVGTQAVSCHCVECVEKFIRKS